MKRKGILLAGGTGSRLYPATAGTSKQLLNVYDKPLIYYSLSLLMQARIREVLVITTPDDYGAMERVLGDGSQWGMYISYETQFKPNGIAEALIIGEEFLEGEACCLVLGDNIIHGSGVDRLLRNAAIQPTTTLFATQVTEAWRYGVVEFDAYARAIRILEKPMSPPSNWVVPGVYFLPSDAPGCAKDQTPSKRGELEITDVNNVYLKCVHDCLRLGDGTVWFDAGNAESLLEASQYVRAVQKRTGKFVACLEEIALDNTWITADELFEQIQGEPNSIYMNYLNALVDRSRRAEVKPASNVDPPVAQTDLGNSAKYSGESTQDTKEM